MENTNFKLKTKVLNRAVSFTSLLLAAGVFIVLLTACPNTAGGLGGESTPSGGSVTPSDFGSFEDAGDYVKITPSANGIIGVAPDESTLPGTEDYWKGVFIKDRKVKLSPYMLGKTEVTYEKWYEVRVWAEGNGYTFANKGLEGWDGTGGGSWPNYANIGKPPTGNKNHPVTNISWRDCIVWCNAYTEMVKGSDAECVYRKSKVDTAVLKSANDTSACDNAYADMNKKGYRLPIEVEWEYAARWQGSDSTNAEKYGDLYLTKLWSASGAKDKWDTDETGKVAWYHNNSGGKTHSVGEKRANYLGLYNMSGNVWEWCFDWWNNDPKAGDEPDGDGFVTDPQGAVDGSTRVVRGGGWDNNADYCTVGARNNGYPDERNDYIGLRLACRP
ncbi:SUMF1/EgtB/PvdO family nonheme iron enzyme [Treponema sp. OMZ 792]|uniref:formylglycine-generating enzyme family protein n=1 Tax=unclassified Treponema TaxID=2638727 RepID=UPI0020A3DFAC|nr:MULTISPECIES: SUMF1/EgtB/PvdO family nonheme iron enzyme [unclassified Treponema]UTC74239.1 SUMF1/EgtB/PvdO family nonheme iron enzyme [Treponema sp. OMZ 792]UTC77478.1 formylglycine-generating enzyme family protein [Treponema sp. OMZ 799]UTC80636.1 formylglycine-generating enzyme family protein [Treponema sp. OMZ 798]